MENETIVPQEMYPFSNFLEKDVTLYWDSRAYTFPALSTTNLLGRIPKATPEDTQGIRKKFAYDLAQIAYFETEDYKKRQAAAPAAALQSGQMLTPPIYSEAMLEPLVERCLEPLTVKAPTVTAIPDEQNIQMNVEKNLKRDTKGRIRSRVVEQGTELKPYED